MSKKVKNQAPLVMIESIDHSLTTDGAKSHPMKFVTVGWLYKETKEGYHITHWAFDNKMADDNNVTSFIVKTVGTRVKRVK